MKKKPLAAKDVVYLIGAGATQSEVSYRGAAIVNLLMKDNDLGAGVSTAVLKKVGETNLLGASSGADVEKLISLLSSAGVTRLQKLADKMRNHYFGEIVDRLVSSKIIDDPFLATALIELHANAVFHEKVERLAGVLTTNHDGLLQVAVHKAHGILNLGMPFESDDFVFTDSQDIPPLLQLHGSFTWQFGVPTRIAKLQPGVGYSKDTTWIPPTITKEARSYPFNKLIARAYELLARHCDVLRIVGASLTQNDWNILSLIFNAQKHRECRKGAPFRIELVMPHDRGVSVQNECSFLKHLVPIGFLTEGSFADYKDDLTKLSPDQLNPFSYWLKEKIRYHHIRNDFDGTPLGTYAVEVAGIPT